MRWATGSRGSTPARTIISANHSTSTNSPRGVRAVARRQSGRAAAHLAHNGIVLDPAALTATANNVPVNLSRREFAILSALMERPEMVRSKDDLASRLYGWQEEVESNAVEVHIHNLRHKIGRDMIETVRGHGYRMRAAGQ